jgi:hypothetical protein
MAKHIARICQPVLLLVENRAEKALGNHFTGSGRRNRFDLIESRDPPDSGELIQKLVDFQFATSEHGLAAAEQQHVEVVNRAVCFSDKRDAWHRNFSGGDRSGFNLPLFPHLD